MAREQPDRRSQQAHGRVARRDELDQDHHRRVLIEVAAMNQPRQISQYIVAGFGQRPIKGGCEIGAELTDRSGCRLQPIGGDHTVQEHSAGKRPSNEFGDVVVGQSQQLGHHRHR
nr:hypothetical protein [Gordonia bronchialis]